MKWILRIHLKLVKDLIVFIICMSRGILRIRILLCVFLVYALQSSLNYCPVCQLFCMIVPLKRNSFRNSLFFYSFPYVVFRAWRVVLMYLSIDKTLFSLVDEVDIHSHELQMWKGCFVGSHPTTTTTTHLLIPPSSRLPPPLHTLLPPPRSSLPLHPHYPPVNVWVLVPDVGPIVPHTHGVSDGRQTPWKAASVPPSPWCHL